jgi:D-alanine-D-alanine ligase-like ATP-grasp enzyme
MTATHKLGIVERLRDESLALQKTAWLDGGQECGISANLADEAAALIEELVAAAEALLADAHARADLFNARCRDLRAVLAKVRPQ